MFDVHVIIQLTDDEKCLAMENIKDIIAVGFDSNKTIVFNNLDYMGGPLYHNVVRIAGAITTNAAQATFGFTGLDSIGKLHFASIQAAPSLSTSFPRVFDPQVSFPCLIPCAIDQDPYFRLTRHVAQKLSCPKPALLHSIFLPALTGVGKKMSSSEGHSAIFLDDTPQQIKKKINKYAFSGGRATVEEHRLLGGDLTKDIAFQYLTFFEPDDQKLAALAQAYMSGDLLSGDLKAACIVVLQRVVREHQKVMFACSSSRVFCLLEKQQRQMLTSSMIKAFFGDGRM